MVKKKIYSFLVATKKVAKNAAIFLLPSLLAYQVNVPQQYAALVAVAIYYIKNYLANK